MTTEIKEVSEAVKAVSDLKEDAKRLRAKIGEAVTRSKNAMGKVESSIVDPLLSAAAELEDLTNTQTNGPPEE